MKKLLLLFTLFSVCVFADVYKTEVDIERYPNSSVAIFLDESELTFQKDNTYEIKNRIIKKILNYKGKKEHSEFKIYYDKRYEEIEILNAFTLKPDGEKVGIPEEEIKILDSPDSFWKLDFAVENVMVLTFKSVEIGDIVEIEFVRKNNKKDKISDYLMFVNSEGTYQKKITFKYPEDKYLGINETNFVEGIKKLEKKENGFNIVTYEMENLEQYLYEEKMPRLSYIFPTVYYSLYKNWKEYFNEIQEIYLKNLHSNLDILEELKKAVDLKADSYTQVEQLKDYFAKNIALIPINNLRSFEIRPLEEIVAKKYGTSFERILLFGIMLDYLGVKNRPVIIGELKNYFEKEKEFINVSDFNYMITEVEIDSEKLFVDPVSEFMRLDEFNENELIGIPISGKLSFQEIHPKKINDKLSKYTIKLDKNGNAKVDRYTYYSGRNAAALREKYKYMTGVDKRKDYEAVLAGISLSVLPITEDRDIKLGETVEVSFKYKHRNFVIKTGNYEYFDLPVYLNPFVFNLPPDERKYPMENLEEGVYRREIQLILPEAKKILEIPKNIDYNNELFHVKREAVVQNGILTIKDMIEYKPSIISLSRYKELYMLNLELSKKKNTRILLKNK